MVSKAVSLPLNSDHVPRFSLSHERDVSVCLVLSVLGLFIVCVTSPSSFSKCCFAIAQEIYKLPFVNSCHHCHRDEKGLLIYCFVKSR